MRRQQFLGRSVGRRSASGLHFAHIPTWMRDPSAGALSVVDHPRVALAGLRDLRLALDGALSSFSGMQKENGMGYGCR